MPQKILVVDDEEGVRLVVKRVLQKAGFSVHVAGDGKEGLEKILKEPYDLILLDWNMPRMDGAALCRELANRPQYKNIPILMMTVRNSEDDELEALHFGVEQYVVKPFKIESLPARVKAALRRAPSPAGPAKSV